MSLGLTELIVFIVFVITIGGSVFWIWMLIDCATKEDNQGNTKIVWIIIILLAHWVGALLYLLVRRRQRIAERGR